MQFEWVSAGGSATYTYAGDGLRASSSGASGTYGFAWDSLTASLPLLLSDGGNDYVYGPNDKVIEQSPVGSDAPTFLSQDRLGSTRLITDQSGNVVATASYDPYGNMTTHTGTTSAFGYDGEYTDPTGLIYLRARYYDPTTGQFLTIDPLVGLTRSPYGYAGGNPINNVDPTGLRLLDPDTGRPDPDAPTDAVGTKDLKPAQTPNETDVPGEPPRIDASELKMTDTVKQHLADVSKGGGKLSRPYGNSSLTLQQIMDSSDPVPDPGGVAGALRWDVPGTMNGSSGTWELVVDPKTDTILHFLFKSSKSGVGLGDDGRSASGSDTGGGDAGGGFGLGDIVSSLGLLTLSIPTSILGINDCSSPLAVVMHDHMKACKAQVA